MKGSYTKMPTAYVLLNTEIGAEKQVLKSLKKIEGVEEAHSLWGVYDIIANIKADNMEKLKYIITKRIEKIGKVNSKLTMIINEKTPSALQEQVFFEPTPIIQ
jgi:DNA-binding Lrp family transcriptional regulator